MLPIIIIAIAVGIGLLAFGAVVAWLTGLLVAVEFLVVTFLILYAFFKLNMIDDDYKWVLLAAPFLMFFVGLGLDKAGVLRIKPLSIQSLSSANPLSLEALLLLVLVIVSVVDIALEVSDK